jgi:ankyrin repeat protein
MSSGEDLMEAIESGDESGVKRCLDDGADAMFADEEGFTALHMACQEGYEGMVTLLLRKGAKVDSTDDDGVTPLMSASEAGHESVVTLLVAENADVNLADKAGKTAILRAAAIAGSEACVARLLAASADVFACPVAGKTLAEVAEKKDAACAKRIKEALSREGAGRRLLEAAEKGRTSAVRLMLDGGADVNATDDDGWNALHFAAADGTVELIELLIAKGLKADTPAKDGATPIELAEEEEHDDAVEALKASL